MRRAAGDIGSWHYFAIAGLVVVVTVCVSQFAKGFLAVAAVLVGLLVGYITAAFAGMVSLDPIREASWFQVPAPMAFGIEFHSAAIIAVTVLAIASSVESIGDLTAVARTGIGRSPSPKELSRGIVADGVGTTLGSLFSAMPNTTFSQNTGIVALTGVVSRYVVAIAGGMLLLAGLTPKVAAAFNTIPYPVLGGATLVMFSKVAAAGIQIIAADVLDRRALLILAVSLGLGVGFSNVNPEALSLMPTDVAMILTSGIVPAMLAAVIMNALIPPKLPPKAENAKTLA